MVAMTKNKEGNKNKTMEVKDMLHISVINRIEDIDDLVFMGEDSFVSDR